MCIQDKSTCFSMWSSVKWFLSSLFCKAKNGSVAIQLAKFTDATICYCCTDSLCDSLRWVDKEKLSYSVDWAFMKKRKFICQEKTS